MSSLPLVIDQAHGVGWSLFHGDCVPLLAGIPDESIGYTIFSPPFGPKMYCYSASPHDFGNGKNDVEFMDQFQFLVSELYRVTKPGRLLSFHCMLIPTTKSTDGFIGLKDFRGDLIRSFVSGGFIFHSETCIWKDPVTAMQRTKALGLLHKQVRKDSCMSRQGIPDYLVTMRKPGENAVEDRVTHTDDDLPVALWQRYASPVWVLTGAPTGDGFCNVSEDINPSDTLQKTSAREEADERHIAPLQLEVIRRAVHLWSNPGDTVLSPFAGIGSEGYVAIEQGRRFVGAELKESYYRQAAKNLEYAEKVLTSQQPLFGGTK